MTSIVDTTRFWEQMKKPAFIRHSRNLGSVHGDFYYTSAPPEEAEGFLIGRIENALRLLRTDVPMEKLTLP